MNPRLASTLIAIVLIGIVIGVLIHRDNEKWRRLGREAYIDHQLADFNSGMAEPQSATLMVFVSILLTATIFGAYELLVFVLFALISKTFPAAAAHQPPPAPSHPFS